MKISKECLQKTLQNFFQNKKEVLFVYLFGSYATGHAVPKSDVDIAVYVNAGNKQEQFEKRLALIADLSKLFKRDVDVIMLNTASPFLKHVIFKEGILIFDRDPSKRIDFELQATNEYFDYKPTLELYNQRLLAS